MGVIEMVRVEGGRGDDGLSDELFQPDHDENST